MAERPGPRRILRVGIVLLGVVMLVTVGIAWWGFGSILLMSRHHDVPPPPPDLGVTEVAINSPNGMLAAWFSAGDAREDCVLLVHGMGGDRRGLMRRAGFFHDAGYAVLAIDLQAHGESGGATVTFGYLEQHDITASVTWLRAKGCATVVVDGFSLGAASALLSAPTHQADALILEAPFATLEDAAFRRMETLLGGLAPLVTPMMTLQLRPRLGFGLDDVRPIDAASAITMPTLWESAVAAFLDGHAPFAPGCPASLDRL